MTFGGLKWWGLPLWGGGKEKNRENCLYDCENDSLEFSSLNGGQNRKVEKKWFSREERKVERKHDRVCLSGCGSKAEDLDWSIGWLEPHGPDFLVDDETDDSFAVLVPCYRDDGRGAVEGRNSHLLNAIKNLSNECFTEENFMEQWISPLQKF